MKIVLLILVTLNLYALSPKEQILNLYKNKEYKAACNFGFDDFKANTNDEEFVSIYGLSCLESDEITRLTLPITLLKFSPQARANSAYFSVILMQKRLLYHALLDNFLLSSFNFPTTEYILSKVFDLYAKEQNKEKKDFYILRDTDDSNTTYKLYLEKDEKLDKIIIEKFYNTQLVKKHTYW